MPPTDLPNRRGLTSWTVASSAGHEPPSLPTRCTVVEPLSGDARGRALSRLAAAFPFSECATTIVASTSSVMTSPRSV